MPNNGRFTKRIDELNTSQQIKTFLRKVEDVASSGNAKIMGSVADIFIKSPACSELSKISHVYEDVISGYGVYPFRGVGTYLELAFPAGGTEQDYKEFFASPRRVAATQNRFSGVFLVSFEQWKSANDLIRDTNFKSLLKFIEANKNNISFVFHVTPEFRDAKDLLNELSSHINLVYLEHFLPDRLQALEYIKSQLKAADIDLTQDALEEIDRLVDEKIDLSSKNYHGYKTLERLSKRLLFELYDKRDVNSVDRSGTNAVEVSGEEIAEVSAKIDVQVGSDLHTHKIGFV